MDFDTQYHSLAKDVFHELARDEVTHGADPVERARHYAERGKPDFVLAYLLASSLVEAEKRELFAVSYERRATASEERAREFDRRFHRPFPLLFQEASRDRAIAGQIRAGKRIRSGTTRQLPMK